MLAMKPLIYICISVYINIYQLSSRIISKKIQYTAWLSTVRCMMYGFGDDQSPYRESVYLVEDLVIAYISDIVSAMLNGECNVNSTKQGIVKVLRINLSDIIRVLIGYLCFIGHFLHNSSMQTGMLN